jgi:type II secretory pathway component PulK
MNQNLVGSMKCKSTTNSRSRRRGSVLVMVMISLLLMSMIAGVLTRVVMTQREYSRATLLRTQAEWLVQSAGRRAAAKLATNSDYTGEMWNISPDELDQSFGASAEIAIASDDESGKPVIKVTVLLPPDDSFRVRLSDVFALPAE